MVDTAVPQHNPELDTTDKSAPKPDDQQIVNILEAYRIEGEDARKTGPNNRDDKWNENLDLYWNRFNFEGKAQWQAQQTMPEVPAFVDRFSAAMKEAIHSAPGGFYTVTDAADTNNDMSDAIKRVTDAWLSTCGTGPNDQPMGFGGVFEEQMKLGALMAPCAAVTWKPDANKGRVAIDAVDPRNYWLDHTGRGLYRFRRTEMDKHELVTLADMKDSKGQPLYNKDVIEQLQEQVDHDEQERRQSLTGGTQDNTSSRQKIQIDEYIATLVEPTEKKAVSHNYLYVVANNRHLIRGGEENPFWHKRDWIVFAPLVTVPLSVYGRSYMEDFGSIAKTFNELTNMLLDAVFTSSMKAFAMVPELLRDPSQANEGISPNKIFLLEEGADARQFLQDIDLGTLSPESFQMWQALKQELREAAGMNEIAFGQFAPKGRTSATEVLETQQSTSALIRSMAATVEERWLDPVLNLTWKTGLQHVSKNDEIIRAAAQPEFFDALMKRRREFVERPLTFRARGITTLLHKSRKLKALLSALQILGSNDILLKIFLQKVSPDRLVDTILDLFEIDPAKLRPSERESTIGELTGAVNSAAERANQAEGPAPDGATAQVGELANVLSNLSGAA